METESGNEANNIGGKRQTFLEELAAGYLEKCPDTLDKLTFVFPNRRAGMYFIRALARQSTTPRWAPRTFSFEDFVKDRGSLVQKDRYSLVFLLYKIYTGVYGDSEKFDNFFFWGEMLLSDFDEIDKQMVNAAALYKNLGKLKEIEAMEFLDERQKELISRFWKTIDWEGKNASWVKFWEKLGLVYQQLGEALRKEGAGYQGLLYREMAGSMEKYCHPQQDNLVFAGFNALTKAEEEIIRYFLENTPSVIHWDLDAYYMEEGHEAGHFLRAYRDRPFFQESFKEPLPRHIESGQKDITILGTSTWTGQARYLATQLSAWAALPGWDEESTVIVLPDEKMLLPVLNSIPDEVKDINVTMGLPLRYTSPYGLFEAMLMMHKNRREGEGITTFYFQDVIRVLRHPLVRSLAPGKVETIIRSLKKEMQFRVSPGDLTHFHPLAAKLFYSPTGNHALELAHAAHALFTTVEDRAEKIYLNAFYHNLSALADVIGKFDTPLSVDSFLRLYRQMASSSKVPFTGEPLKGLQIMGAFETRNLDFDNVIILSMNEDYFPKSGPSQSFIPYSLRKAYEMSVFDEAQSMQAYLFYRLLQRAGNVLLLYNASGDVMGGEQSRYLQQLRYRFPLRVKDEMLRDSLSVNVPRPVAFPRDETTRKSLSRFCKEGEKPDALSPSALHVFIECKLKFYFKYIARIREPEEPSEDIDPMVFGNILHRVMELAYIDTPMVTKEVIERADKNMGHLTDTAFWEIYDPKNKGGFRFEGQHVIIREVVMKLAREILGKDRAYAPFGIKGLELGKDKSSYPYVLEGSDGPLRVNLGGIIDRVDRKEGILRIIDYKTGSDERLFEDLPSLFERGNKKRNKAAFQVLYYCWLYSRKHDIGGDKIQPGIFNGRGLYASDFSTRLTMNKGTDGKKTVIIDALPYLEEFSQRLDELLREVFFTEVYDQTIEEYTCNYCSYRAFCHGYA